MIRREEGYRSSAPGELTEAWCHVCGTRCTIRRNVMGPTCFAEAMGGLKQLHDTVTCPHSGADWHNHAVRLRAAIHETPSARVAALISADLADVLTGGLTGGGA